jgi:formylglycine-generating enzyme required for sulfatase activity
VEQVSWNDVQTFLGRLNASLNANFILIKPFRLPSEAEWEYAARAGTPTPYWWGKNLGKGNANCDGCGSQWDNKETAPVGSFKSNAFGLYDTVGNVWEWVQDCRHDSYADAPSDGSAWQADSCTAGRVLRGGSWDDGARAVRVSARDWHAPDNRGERLGLRLAQDTHYYRFQHINIRAISPPKRHD